MNRRLTPLLSGIASLALTLVATGCASSGTVVPGRTLALASVEYPEGFKPAAVEVGQETPATRFGVSFLRELEKAKQYQVVDARNRGVRWADLEKKTPRAEALHRDVPADAYLAVRLFDCAARPMSEVEFRGQNQVTVYFFRGECAPEVTAFDAAGKTLAKLQKTGRWDSPRQERPDTAQMQYQALWAAIDKVTLSLAQEIRPDAAAKK